MKQTKRTYTIYELGNGFCVEFYFDEKEKILESWLYNENIGIKEYVVGLPTYQKCENKIYSIPELIELTFYQIEDMIEYYKEEYMNN